MTQPTSRTLSLPLPRRRPDRRLAQDDLCYRCQRLIRRQRFMAHGIHRGRRLLHPQDEHLAGNPFGDRGWLPLCPGCVTQIGAEWCYEVEPELR